MSLCFRRGSATPFPRIRSRHSNSHSGRTEFETTPQTLQSMRPLRQIILKSAAISCRTLSVLMGQKTSWGDSDLRLVCGGLAKQTDNFTFVLWPCHFFYCIIWLCIEGLNPELIIPTCHGCETMTDFSKVAACSQLNSKAHNPPGRVPLPDDQRTWASVHQICCSLHIPLPMQIDSNIDITEPPGWRWRER